MKQNIENLMMGKFPYDDIVGMERPVSKRHTPMSRENRAAQFAPFAALTGHDAALSEVARTTSGRRELSSEELQQLSSRLTYAMSQPGHPAIAITYFHPDSRKEGGEYVTVRGAVKKVEVMLNRLTLTDGKIISLSEITDIEGDLFSDIEL